MSPSFRSLRLLVAAPLVVLVVACGKEQHGGGEVVTSQAGAVVVDASLRPDPPRQDAVLHLTLSRAGQPVEHAAITARATMPAMGAMPEMRSEGAATESGHGEYDVRFDLPMGGTWSVATDIAADGDHARTGYRFTVGVQGLTAAEATGATAAPPTRAGADATAQLDAPVLAALQQAFARSDAVADALVDDRPDPLAADARALAETLRAARALVASPSGDVATLIDRALPAADGIATATDLAQARERFAIVQESLIALAARDPRLQRGRTVFRCPMVKHFGKWTHAGDHLANPYMGRAMPGCGERSTWSSDTAPAAAAPTSATGDPKDIAYWTCSMHPSVKRSEAGKCPICSMDLEPVTKGEIASGEIIVDAVRRQLIGVRTAPVERADLTVRVHGFGVVVPDERRLVDIDLKVGGWITALKADTVGAAVAKGQPLFEIYSPDLYTAQKELIAAGASGAVRDAARERLRLYDLDDQQIDAIAKSGEARTSLPIPSPIDGYVVRKDLVQGSAVQPGMAAMRLASLDAVWVVADVFPQDLPLVAVGQHAVVTLPSQPGTTIDGSVGFISPEVRDQTRAGQVRIELPNPRHALRPNQYTGVDIAVDLGERTVVPKEAVLYAGERRLVFVDLGEGRLRPQAITVGHASEDRVEVVDGLKPGDVVVTSGHFLLSAESRIRSAEAFWGAAHDQR